MAATARAMVGPGRVVARYASGRTVIAEAHATSPLRFVQAKFPAGRASAAICLVTFGGGLVDGDAIDTLIEVEEGATLLVFTQSTTKVFRGAASQSIRAKVAGTLVLLPDPVAAFKDASYTQRIDVDLTPAGSCLVLDGFTSGRAAFGERWAMKSLDLRTTVREDERTIAVDALRLDRADGSIAARTGSYDAFSTLLAVRCLAPNAAPPAPPTADLAVATSPLARTDGAIVRIAASSPAAAIAAARSRLRNLPDIDIVDPFASRY
jgi:urease accessory protein